MRIIFSRKGFDSQAGGHPSPIVDHRPISLPIPARATPSSVRYSDLNGPYVSFLRELTRRGMDPGSWCHLDPDLKADVLHRLPGWRGVFGQDKAAQSHLANQGVRVGDLFLFWGLFQNVERRSRWKFVGSKEHRLFGWLQVGEILNLGEDGSFAVDRYPWLRDHPHVRDGWRNPNFLYIGSEELGLGGYSPGVPGWGVFQYGYRLTADGCRPSTWSVPDWLHPARGGVGMTYHGNPRRWGTDGTVECVSRGQEFVAEIEHRADALQWLRELFPSDAAHQCHFARDGAW